MKSPFNWVGNKYKFIPEINKVVEGRFYDSIIDMFMGSGNILLNLECNSKIFFGNDKQKLIPSIFRSIQEQGDFFENKDFEDIINHWGKFSSNQNYYEFRDFWNRKFLSGVFDRNFIVETSLLLKMCSNSMVRFNGNGVFNQGFRGLGNEKEFFKQSMIDMIVENLNQIIKLFGDKKFIFTNFDFREYKESDKKRLLILDPPYTLGDRGVYNKDFSKENSDILLDMIENTKHDFIYFNYIQHGEVIFEELVSLIKRKNFICLDIGDNNVSAGQAKTKNGKYVREVMVTNVQM